MRHEVRIRRTPDAALQEVTVRTHMHRYYLEFLQDIPPNSEKPEERFKNISKCIIWGFLYIEALTNFACELAILRCCRVSRVARDFWLLSERAEIDSKITFLASVYQVNQQAQNRIRKMIEKVRKMRNRLVHYKDEPTIVDSRRLDRPDSDGQPFLETLMEAMPDPEIVRAVLSFGVETRRSEILEIGAWIEALLKNAPKDISSG